MPRYRIRSPQPPPRRGAGVMDAVHRLLSWRVILGALMFAALLTMAVLLLFWLSRPPNTQRAPATAVLQILAAPSATASQAAAGPVGEGTAFPTPPPGVIAIGASVQVTGTGGDGLRLRNSPGLDGQVILVASEAEVFNIEDGPKELDGYTWWYLVGPFDEQRRGWAVVNFLQVVQNP